MTIHNPEICPKETTRLRYFSLFYFCYYSISFQPISSSCPLLFVIILFSSLYMGSPFSQQPLSFLPKSRSEIIFLFFVLYKRVDYSFSAFEQPRSGIIHTYIANYQCLYLRTLKK
jgi:hypothetical protein